MSDIRKPYAVYVITRHGLAIGEQLMRSLPGVDLYVSPKFLAEAPEGSKELSLPMGPTLEKTFQAYDCHIFIISVGAVVRMIAPLLQNKKIDPAVICVDDAANFSICVLSGHVGKGNVYAQETARILDAAPVITTASDVQGTLTVDILGREFGWRLNHMEHNVTRGCAAVVNEEKVLFVQETGEPNFWPLDKALPPGVEYANSLSGVKAEDYGMLLVASDRLIEETEPALYANAVVYRPRSLVLGLGCDSNTPFELVEKGVINLMKKYGLALDSVREIASIDKKKDEPALKELAEKDQWPFRTYTAEVLDVVPGIETPSEVVKKFVGTRAVAEPAALLSAGAEKLLVPKQAYTEPGYDRNMTLVSRVFPLKLVQMEKNYD